MPLLHATIGERAPRKFQAPPEIGALLEAHRAARPKIIAEKLHFQGIDGKTGYNPSAMYRLGGRDTISVRVESKESEDDSRIVSFQRVGKKSNGLWQPGDGLSRELALQDPYVTKTDGKHLVGGVHVTPKKGGGHEWDQRFYFSHDRLKTFETEEDSEGKRVPKAVLIGPKGMKDVRPGQLSDSRMAVYSRPQGDLALSLGAPGPRGSVGFIITPGFRELNADVIAQAPLLSVQFPADQWWGVNSFLQLDRRTNHVFGHAARFDPRRREEPGEPRDYYPLDFFHDFVSGEVWGMQISAERADFGPLGDSKRPALSNVVFTGGLGRGFLSVGAGDAEAYLLRMPHH